MSEQLKPCPHCGTEPIYQHHEPHTHSGRLKQAAPGLLDHGGSHTIECAACGNGMIADDKETVAARWNRRTPDLAAAAQAERERFREIVEAKAFAAEMTPRAFPEHAEKWGAVEKQMRELLAELDEDTSALDAAIKAARAEGMKATLALPEVDGWPAASTAIRAAIRAGIEEAKGDGAK